MQLAHDISSFGDVLNMPPSTILRIFVFRMYMLFIIPGQIITIVFLQQYIRRSLRREDDLCMCI